MSRRIKRHNKTVCCFARNGKWNSNGFPSTNQLRALPKASWYLLLNWPLVARCTDSSKTLSPRVILENPMWRPSTTNFPSAMNSDHQDDDMDFDKNDKSKPNGMYLSRILNLRCCRFGTLAVSNSSTSLTFSKLIFLSF